MGISALIKGYLKFKKGAYELHEKEFVNLITNGQRPNALFISCSDSRVVPELITQCDPGTLFHHRQVGNFIPPYSDNLEGIHTSTLATIEYAIEGLKIKDIIICSHSKCGACANLYDDISNKPELKFLNTWLTQSPKLQKFVELQKNSGLHQDNLAEITERVSLLCQVENLLTYPIIYKKIKEQEIFLHAWYYDIASGDIDFFDSNRLDFIRLADILNEQKK
ncbi:MAG: carbonic anhydrase [Francisellaceae bacterium]|jgi:carbonic anhydrase|nr:carbonic anhydrase [Francisellaceae bacterium]MBT6208135.1 carbonic anhydrase [Francisellaceae bacterium]MBT6539924.1 carbonic anhydrase [Francisellaceae bacterium]